MKRIVRTLAFRRNFRVRIQFNPVLKEKYYHQVQLFVTGDAQATRPNDLNGSMKGLKSFSITSDVRIIYQEKHSYYLFLDIGTHKQIYHV